jgi:phage terminase large subunit-like protein
MLYKCGYDVRFSREFVAKMESYGFECEVVLQSKQTLSNAVKLCENDFRSRLINYNENPVDMWTLGNAALEVDNYGNCQIVKIKGQPGKRIDGAVTYSIVYEMFRRYRSDIIALAK